MIEVNTYYQIRINIPMELLERIRDYINESDRSIIMFTELFERFKMSLLRIVMLQIDTFCKNY